MSSVEKSDIEKCGWTLDVKGNGNIPSEPLGTGHFAKVRKVRRLSDGLIAACKIIKKPKGRRVPTPQPEALGSPPATASYPMPGA